MKSESVKGDTDDLIKGLESRKRGIRFRELKEVLLEWGYDMRQQKRGGSHYVFKHPEADTLIVLVSHGKNDMLPEYQVMKAIRAIEELREQSEKQR
jgi:predicted RNA binding protein YcfA (HicA-like mRNA interferase family)